MYRIVRMIFAAKAGRAPGGMSCICIRFEPISGPFFFDRNHFTNQLTNYFAMNTLNKNIKISVLFSLIAIGATLAGCASGSSKPASTDSTSSASTTASASASDSSPAATQGATTTGNAGGQTPISWDDLNALMKKDALSTPPAAQ